MEVALTRKKAPVKHVNIDSNNRLPTKMTALKVCTGTHSHDFTT